MNFVFENKSQLENFINCPDINTSGCRRFSQSPIGDIASRGITNFRFNVDSLIYPTQYLITTGVNHHPQDWTGRSTRKSLFYYLNDRYLKDLQEGRAMLLIDQSLEGHQTLWLWNWFHSECQTFGINPRAVIYVTGNQIAPEQYQAWAVEHTDKITVIAYAHFERDVRDIAKEHGISETVDIDLQYRIANQHLIKDYNCMHKRPRAHRLWFYSYLYKNNLLSNGLVSQNPFVVDQTYLDGKCLPTELVEACNRVLPLTIYDTPNNTHPDNYYIRRIVKDVYRDTWLSVISEVAYSNSDATVFISEKTFKAIACGHPFIIVGSAGTLAKLRSLGYKTFDGFIDETYDTLPPFERFDAIIAELKRITQIQDKAEWYSNMKDIIVHNYNTLQYNSNHKDRAIIKLEQCYKEYFKK